jgi:hypothetical protein
VQYGAKCEKCRARKRTYKTQRGYTAQQAKAMRRYYIKNTDRMKDHAARSWIRRNYVGLTTEQIEWLVLAAKARRHMKSTL